MYGDVDADVCSDTIVLRLAGARTRAQRKLTFHSITKVTRLPDSQPAEAPVHIDSAYTDFIRRYSVVESVPAINDYYVT